ncbi:hypothetical protein LX15_005049 [Streptoalloteichus tenebrarius]|uniref:Minimal CRISPR polymerase domain-containing protein n=2 Tax=Streptoalloteichus tenebrarius (strain ATCC 17920 / DSM 40477 / JCM 4838 / CBS 697.72 / NBRC 16177 / NCIMB 11028 / NRRL B-12390 / A12253. 1 / ISP 5477) TaxID=1933 RepID=A0ABT1I0L9_STRSD|nr:hypothetical protein [Streptoalloteichus tenebrarius]BFF03728.1 hypothetical protein GCM10020241_54030 [Streptoalloteichus tenebrarius]
MARKRFELRHWTGDARQLVFWVAVALTVGAIPDLSVNVSAAFLLVVWLGAVVCAAVIWFVDKRKEGIAVYVELQRPGDRETRHKDLVRLLNQRLSRSHKGWFRAGPDRGEGSIHDRVDWMLRTIEYRLEEMRIQADYKPTVFLYLRCHLEESFVLGQRVSKIWDESDPLAAPGDRAAVGSNLAVRVRSVSDYERREGEIFELDFSKVTRTSKADPVDVQIEVEALGAAHERARRRPKLAIVLYAAKEKDAAKGKNAAKGYQSFKDSALKAASGEAPSGYVANRDDVCDHALIISISSDLLIDGLRNRNAEGFVNRIQEAYEKCCMETYGSNEVPVRIFMQGPSILAFAAGVLFPEGSKLISWNPTLPEASTVNVSSEYDIIAIVDGDDIGSGMERKLLEGDLSSATAYSEKFGSAFDRLLRRVQEVPGVDLISSGGDSAIFGFPRASLAAFEDAVEVFRSTHDVGMSCGYGRDCQKAFVALRLAKTSGKNVTRGEL